MNENSSVSLKEIDRIEILTIIDNYIDLLLTSTDVVTRPPQATLGDISTDTLLAEHGLALLVTVYQGENKHTILLDTGYSKVGVPHNMKQLGIEPDQIEAIVISHAHMDHTGSLYDLLDKIPGRIPLVFHPDVFLSPRFFGLPDGQKILFPNTLIKSDLEDRNVEILERKDPTLLVDDMVLVTGEVERTTEFEKGLPNAFVERDGEIEQDPILDDQSIVVNLKGKGLVVISGCSHAGIINTILYTKKITGVENIHAVLGGFHLTGPFFEKIIDPTIEELKKMTPRVVVPMHCTGWNAIKRFSEAFSDSFVLNSVGSKIILSS